MSMSVNKTHPVTHTAIKHLKLWHLTWFVVNICNCLLFSVHWSFAKTAGFSHVSCFAWETQLRATTNFLSSLDVIENTSLLTWIIVNIKAVSDLICGDLSQTVVCNLVTQLCLRDAVQGKRSPKDWTYFLTGFCLLRGKWGLQQWLWWESPFIFIITRSQIHGRTTVRSFQWTGDKTFSSFNSSAFLSCEEAKENDCASV